VTLRRAVALALLLGCGGDRDAGQIEGARRPAVELAEEGRSQDAAASALVEKAGESRALPSKHVLFGDLHVHTTYSVDAFVFSLPVMTEGGAHPPADACDFARHCAALDFFALTDHAEGLTPEHWEAEKESVRQCNALAGDAADPDLVAFLGFEWTQVGATPEDHFGHRNVIYRGEDGAELPARPISARVSGGGIFEGVGGIARARWIDPWNWGEYADFRWLLERLGEVPECAAGVDTRELPQDCHETAASPDVLLEKLRQAGQKPLVIPHGTAWGFYTPGAARFDHQLTRQHHDPQLGPLVEIMSGHGNSEEYRSWRPVEEGREGEALCPAPTPDYLPCCWQAGEIVRARCGDLPAEECETRVEEARRLAAENSVSPHLVLADTSAEDWLDCGQCRDCFKPSFALRPTESVQYGLALSNFAEPGPDGAPLRFRWGFLASSDNHTARPGTGYKQVARRGVMTDATGARTPEFRERQRESRFATQRDPQRAQEPRLEELPLAAQDAERVTSFLYPGGLAAVHAEGRDRGAIWRALERREVYATSGPRILLWFDLLNGPSGPMPMGSEVALVWPPLFEVRAVGSFVQKPGCPESSAASLSAERLGALCGGECYHPSDQRHPITAIEVVRIRPQSRPGEEVDALIEDPWLRLACPRDPRGCVVRFEDPEYLEDGRDTLYYVRALQEETPAVNGAGLRSELDAEGRVLRTRPCYGDDRTPFDDDCLAPVQERAWSSPIFVDRAR
jgi:hypothetical protein